MEEKTTFTDDELNQAIEIVNKLPYPNELVWHEARASKLDLTTIDKHEHTTMKKYQYSFLANLSYDTRRKMQNLGLIVIDINELNACNTITSSYSLPVRIHSRRHDVEMSCADFWNKKRSEVLNIAKVQMLKYLDHYKPVDLPPSHRALENECAITLFKSGIPGCFPATLVTFLIDELAKLPDFKRFNSNKIHMLDISAGWGDRLLAACSRKYKYTGCDPNTAMQDIYREIIEAHGNAIDQRVICSPFEDWDSKYHQDTQPNFMISSPPFFNLEIYSNESTQSSERYPAINDWIEKFLKPSLKKASEILAFGSPVILHLSDVIDFKNSSKSIIFVDGIIRWCVDKLGWKLIGNYGFTTQDMDKESEDEDVRKDKDEKKLNPKGIVKKYNNGMRCNAKGEYFSQALWVFRT